MTKKICAKCFFIFFLAALIWPGAVRAETAFVLQAYVSEDVLTIFTNGRLRYDSLKCAISNQDAIVAASGTLSEGGAKVKTTVLVDVSKSGEAKELLGQLIENKPANEEFKIVAFGQRREILSEFTADRYDLINALEKIKAEDREAKIYDAIYDTIPSLGPEANQPVFYRTLLITGGGAETEMTEITREELFLKLQSGRYPVDIAEINAFGPDKDLAAMARVSGGRYYRINKENTAQSVAKTLGAGDYFYYSVKIPPVLLDGSVRQTDIGDGVNQVSLDLKFPVYAAPNPAGPQKKNGEGFEGAAELGEDGDGYIRAGFAFLAGTALMISAGAVRKKKTKTFSVSGPGFTAGNETGDTEFSGGKFKKECHIIKLSSINNPGKTWTFPIEGGLSIGRSENCALRLYDRSVSRQQCKIIVEDAKFVAVHLGATNKTAVNGNIADKSAPLQVGDKIRFGREGLRVDYLHAPEKTAPADCPDSLEDAGKEKTALLF